MPTLRAIRLRPRLPTTRPDRSFLVLLQLNTILMRPMDHLVMIVPNIGLIVDLFLT